MIALVRRVIGWPEELFLGRLSGNGGEGHGKECDGDEETRTVHGWLRLDEKLVHL